MFTAVLVVGVILVYVLVQWQRGELFTNRDQRRGDASGGGGTGDGSDADCADGGGDGGGGDGGGD
jgi:hypothetical protein